jgi:hypothetical protein
MRFGVLLVFDVVLVLRFVVLLLLLLVVLGVGLGASISLTDSLALGALLIGLGISNYPAVVRIHFQCPLFCVPYPIRTYDDDKYPVFQFCAR